MNFSVWLVQDNFLKTGSLKPIKMVFMQIYYTSLQGLQCNRQFTWRLFIIKAQQQRCDTWLQYIIKKPVLQNLVWIVQHHYVAALISVINLFGFVVIHPLWLRCGSQPAEARSDRGDPRSLQVKPLPWERSCALLLESLHVSEIGRRWKETAASRHLY